MGDAIQDDDLPSMLWATTDVLNYMARTFGLSDRETVAAMGAHTLGRLSRKNSGMPDASWTRRSDQLDNDYYKMLFSPSNPTKTTDRYIQRSIRTDGTASYYWERQKENTNNESPSVEEQYGGGPPRGRTQILLNSDMALVSDFSNHFTNMETGQVGCVLHTTLLEDEHGACPVASTFGVAWMYSNDNNLWLNDFRDVFFKIATNGVDTSECIADDATLCFVGNQT